MSATKKNGIQYIQVHSFCIRLMCAPWQFFFSSRLNRFFFSFTCTLSRLWIGLFELITHTHTPMHTLKRIKFSLRSTPKCARFPSKWLAGFQCTKKKGKIPYHTDKAMSVHTHSLSEKPPPLPPVHNKQAHESIDMNA